MKFCIIGEKEGEVILWNDLITNTFPNDQTIAATSLQEANIEEIDFIMYLLSDIDDEFLLTVNTVRAYQVPILCVVSSDDLNNMENIHKQLSMIGVQGILDSRKTSMENLKTAIKLVCNGGVYIAPTLESTKGKETGEGSSEKFDLVEWRIFSMSAQGICTEAISQSLGITEQEVEDFKQKVRIIFLKNQQNKTK